MLSSKGDLLQDLLPLMKKWIIVLIILLLIAGCAGGFLRRTSYLKEHPSEERIPVGEYFDTGGDDVAIFFDEVFSKTKGRYIEGRVFLPLSWVNENLNDHFFWDEKNSQMLYALPEEIISLGKESEEIRLVSGKPYISLEYIEPFCNAQFSEFYNNGVHRVFIDDTWSDRKVSLVRKDAVLRTGASAGQRIITDLSKDEKVFLMEESKDGWSHIVTEDGFRGYVQENLLTRSMTETRKSTYKAPEYTNISYKKKIVLGWHQVGSRKNNSSCGKLLDAAPALTVISPTWFSISDNEGNISSLADDSYVEEAHARGIHVWALADNFSSSIRTLDILSDTEKRRHLIEELVGEICSHNIDGLNIDFEALEAECSEYYIQFMRELSAYCRLNSIVLSVDVPNPAPFNAIYRRDALAECCDYIINMGYDEHYAGGKKGSVSSITFFAGGIEESLLQVPAEKLIAALPFYTRIWTDNDSRAVSISAAAEWIQENDVVLVWNDDCGQYYGEAETKEGKCYLWNEDAESLLLKLKIIKENDLAGTACWRLGLDNPEIWNLFR